jgi:hypothetical protein
MADVKGSLLLMGALGVILLVLIVVFSVSLLIGQEFQEQVCISSGSSINATTGVCIVEGIAYNATVTLIEQIVLVVGFIGLVVLTAIGAILIGMARGFMKEADFSRTNHFLQVWSSQGSCLLTLNSRRRPSSIWWLLRLLLYF